MAGSYVAKATRTQKNTMQGSHASNLTEAHIITAVGAHIEGDDATLSGSVLVARFVVELDERFAIRMFKFLQLILQVLGQAMDMSVEMCNK